MFRFLEVPPKSERRIIACHKSSKSNQMPTKNVTIGIQHFKTLLSGNFYKTTTPLDGTSIKVLFDQIELEWANGKPVLRKIRETGGAATNYSYSILCIPLKPTP
jgi:hypothetical protein